MDCNSVALLFNFYPEDLILGFALTLGLISVFNLQQVIDTYNLVICLTSLVALSMLSIGHAGLGRSWQCCEFGRVSAFFS